MNKWVRRLFYAAGLFEYVGCNQESKKAPAVEIMNRRKLDVFALCETGWKGMGK